MKKYNITVNGNTYEVYVYEYTVDVPEEYYNGISDTKVTKKTGMLRLYSYKSIADGNSAMLPMMASAAG